MAVGRAISYGMGGKINMSKELITGKSHEWIEGFTEGIRAFAYWKDGEQFVGSCGTTLKSVMVEIHNYTNAHPRNYKATL